MTLRTFGVGTQIEPTSSNNKCLAAQWNSSRGVDWAGTPYACVSPSYKETGPLGDTKVKQQWHLLPVPGKKNQYKCVASLPSRSRSRLRRRNSLIPENHLSNMRTRALSSGRLTTAGGYHSTAIDTFNAVRRPLRPPRSRPLTSLPSRTTPTSDGSSFRREICLPLSTLSAAARLVSLPHTYQPSPTLAPFCPSLKCNVPNRHATLTSSRDVVHCVG